MVKFVFVSFEPLILLVWVFLSAFLPGALISFSVLKKDDFLFIEKLFIGFALGMIILPLIPFLLYFIAGIKYSYEIALLSVGLLYLIALALFVKNRMYEGIKLPAVPKIDSENITISKESAISVLLLLVIILGFMVRVNTYSPIFQELDPYYYTYITQQLLVLGENPLDDQTAWYPELVVNHRDVSNLSYLEAIWYSLYTGGAEYSNMLLALVASMYPPVAALLAIFFIYLFVALVSKREWGLVSAGLAAFIPVFILKLSAGEQEAQPYAFFSLFFFYAMYVLSLQKKDLRFSVLAGIGFAAVSLGSASEILAVVSVMLFLALYSVILYFRDEDESSLRQLAISNGIIFLIGPLLGSAILADIFKYEAPRLSIVVPFFIILAFVGLLYFLKQRLADRQKAALALGAVVVLGLVVLAVTPLGEYATKSSKSAFEIAVFREPLHRTIAEQNPASARFGSQMGFIGEEYHSVDPNTGKQRPGMVSTMLTPLTMLISAGSEEAASDLDNVVSSIVAVIFLPISFIVNLVLAIFVGIVNLVLGTSVEFEEKANSFLLFWMLAFWIAVTYSAVKLIRKDEENLSILLLAFIMPGFVVGLIKAKYTIYAAVLLAIAIGFTLGQTQDLFSRIFKDERNRKMLYMALILVGLLLVVLQFAHKGFSPSLLWGSVQPLYQNNPDALSVKFQQFCDDSGNPAVCAAAADPMGYASQGTNYQYNRDLCMLSLFSEYSYLQSPGKAPAWEYQAAVFRCQRISYYWTDSMEWIRYNTPDDSRTTSWWDYGHWINFFGQKNTVLRNEHRSTEMIGAVADGYLDATPEELRQWMQEHDSEYALFDMELVHSGSLLGGKYGALNYLSCAWNNETTVEYSPSMSQFEAEHLWETIYISGNPCTISELSNKSGFIAYKVYEDVYMEGDDGDAEFLGTFYRPNYIMDCVAPQTPEAEYYCRNFVHMEPAYCVGEVTLVTGESMLGTYHLNETYPTGDLKMNKAFLQLPFELPTTYHLGPVMGVTLFYTHDSVWLEDGNIKSGYEDRTGEFYDSNIYNALFLNYLPGFELEYTSPGEMVKIYKIAD